MPIYLYLYTMNILKPAKQPIEWGLAKQPIERLRAKGQGKTNMQRCKVENSRDAPNLCRILLKYTLYTNIEI